MLFYNVFSKNAIGILSVEEFRTRAVVFSLLLVSSVVELLLPLLMIPIVKLTMVAARAQMTRPIVA